MLIGDREEPRPVARPPGVIHAPADHVAAPGLDLGVVALAVVDRPDVRSAATAQRGLVVEVLSTQNDCLARVGEVTAAELQVAHWRGRADRWGRQPEVTGKGHDRQSEPVTRAHERTAPP